MRTRRSGARTRPADHVSRGRAPVGIRPPGSVSRRRLPQPVRARARRRRCGDSARRPKFTLPGQPAAVHLADPRSAAGYRAKRWPRGGTQSRHCPRCGGTAAASPSPAPRKARRYPAPEPRPHRRPPPDAQRTAGIAGPDRRLAGRPGEQRRQARQRLHHLTRVPLGVRQAAHARTPCVRSCDSSPRRTCNAPGSPEGRTAAATSRVPAGSLTHVTTRKCIRLTTQRPSDARERCPDRA